MWLVTLWLVRAASTAAQRSPEAGATEGPAPTLRSHWATPLFTHQLDGTLNARILNEAAAMREADPAGGRARSNRGGWRSVSNDLQTRRDLKALSLLRAQIEAAVDKTWHTGKTKGHVLLLSEMWIMMLGAGDSVGVHTHAGAMLAGVYWVNAPEALLAGASAGALKLRDPRVQTAVLESLG